MTVYSKINVIYRLQKWLDSVPGQTFLNYAYSWGASVVILGALFKLTHLPGANIMLYIGMGTEVIVFFISGFDRPFDKTAIGKDLPTHVQDDSEEDVEPAGVVVANGALGPISSDPNVLRVPSDPSDLNAASAQNPAGGTIVIGGSVAAAGVPTIDSETSTAMEEATSKYVDELNNLTEMLGKVAEQSKRLSVDSEEMENLNRTLTGICKIYEMQLKSASSQIGTIDQINDQTHKLAEQIAELNKIYARMIEAMTVNMKGAAPAGL